MADSKPKRDTDELARRGTEVFEQEVRPLLRPEDDGKFVAVDLGTGEFEVHEDDYTAVMRLRAPTRGRGVAHAGRLRNGLPDAPRARTPHGWN